jgi:hypothetical protein
MGLDMYAYVAARAGQQDEYNEQEGDWDPETREWVTKDLVSKPHELAYWRKHPNLHGWMNRLWDRKGRPGIDEQQDTSFNGIELELTWQDIEDLEQAVTHKQLPSTSGFFFGQDADKDYYEQDLRFVREARAELFLGLKVFYNSSW